MILTPEHAKRLLLSLQENITRYESNVGKIEIPAPQRHSPGDFPLGGGQAQPVSTVSPSR